MYNTMGRSKRLSPVLRVAENREKKAAQVVARARQRLHYYEDKLNELKSYREEYSQSLNTGLFVAMTAPQLREYQNFIRQLDEGIRQLSEKIEGQKQINLRDEKQWISAKQRTDSLDKLIDKLQDMERNFQENREANEIDERSQRTGNKGQGVK